MVNRLIGRKKEKLSPLQEAVRTAQKKLQRWEKRKKHWKMRLYVTVVFPVFLVVLTIKVIKTYVRIKLFEMGTKAASPFAQQEKDGLP